ncbi:hypothetical protein [Nocardia niwae]|uniref:Uncharacterized protein n=1 Tax=Nocardia niwae TaxID=626084 RepID=A0ABV2XGB7_9NOCA|nr:hypothetical protein [Nocardia niwae]
MDWGFLFAAATSAAGFALLFQPWLSASGSGGEARSDAFGRVTGITHGFDEWSVSKFRDVNISGAWGLLAAAAMMITVFAVVAQLRSRTRVLAQVIMGSSVAAAILVLIALLYLNARGPELRILIDPGEGLGAGLLHRFFDEGATAASDTGDRRMAGAGLTLVAFIAGVLSCAGAVAAVAQGSRRYGSSPMRALSWLVTPLPAEQPQPPVAAEAPRPAPRPAAHPTADAAERLLWDELVFDDDLVANVTWVRNTYPPGHPSAERRSPSAPILTR